MNSLVSSIISLHDVNRVLVFGSSKMDRCFAEHGLDVVSITHETWEYNHYDDVAYWYAPLEEYSGEYFYYDRSVLKNIFETVDIPDIIVINNDLNHEYLVPLYRFGGVKHIYCVDPSVATKIHEMWDCFRIIRDGNGYVKLRKD